MTFKTARRSTRTGCGLVLVHCVVTCALLLLNRMLVVSLYAALVPPALDNPRFRVLLQFLAMVGFLLPEWWMIDLAVRQIRKLFKLAEAFREHH